MLSLMTFALSGCATVGLPRASDDEAIKKGEKAVVLLRANVEVGGKPVDIPKWLWLEVASISEIEAIQGSHPASPSSDTRQTGWSYLILRAGETYYLRPNLPWYNPLIPSMWFHVPRDKRLVYIGSISTSCYGRKPGDIPEKNSCSDVSLNDETTAAKAVAHKLFASYGELSTSLMRPWPIVPDSRSQPVITPDSSLSLAVSTEKTMLAPGWYSMSFEKSMFFVAPGSGTFIDLIILAADLAYLPIGTAIGAAGGAHSESKWQPCVDMLSEGLRSYNYAQEIETAVSDALRTKEVRDISKITADIKGMEGTVKNTSELILQIEMNRVALTECKKGWEFFVDTSIRGSLRQAYNNHFLYDRVFGESDREGHYYNGYYHYLYPYQSATSPPSPCRKIEEYCGANGLDIVREQLISAVNAAAQEIAKDLTQKQKEEESVVNREASQ